LPSLASGSSMARALAQRGFLGVVDKGAGLLDLLHIDVAVAFFGSRVLVRVSSNDVSSCSAYPSEI